ncbi:LysR family transcriptional regulator [Micromonospora sp. NPDC006431]|uniref:LysR family transcriptional regulator n=1 Tax=Micromonospora sp. NPDC006431 TaxID=3364235 RepID=UPI0036849C18
MAEELHFGRTAQRLHLTTARVSQSIKKQERRIGAQLFDRTSRTVRPTPLGEQLYTDLKAAYGQIPRTSPSATPAGPLGAHLAQRERQPSRSSIHRNRRGGAIRPRRNRRRCGYQVTATSQRSTQKPTSSRRVLARRTLGPDQAPECPSPEPGRR